MQNYAKLRAMDEVMDTDQLAWDSFWDLATPDQMALVMDQAFGELAPGYALEAATAAIRDRRATDYAFWKVVLVRLIRLQSKTLH